MTVRLRGKNQVDKFRRVAKRLASKIASIEDVAGVVFLGGLVRGFADEFSDLDITVFLSTRDESLRMQVYKIGLDEEKQSHIDIDLEVHFLEDLKRWRWDEADKRDFSKAKIVFDPKGEIRKVLKEKLRLPEDFWLKRIVACAEYLKWYCCPSREGTGTIAEVWINRGDLLAAHYCLSYAVDLLLKTLFALNREFLPAPKWRVFCSYELKWLPSNYKELIEKAVLIKDLSVRDLNRRLKIIRKIWRNILPKVENETGLTADQISKYYVEKILHQTWIPSRH